MLGQKLGGTPVDGFVGGDDFAVPVGFEVAVGVLFGGPLGGIALFASFGSRGGRRSRRRR